MKNNIDDIELTKKCKCCGKKIQAIQTDTLGRVTTHTSDYCGNYCRNKYLTTHTHPGYFKDYYKNNPEKYIKQK